MAQPEGREPRARRSYAKSAAVRETIVDAALEVFAAEGYRSGSLRVVAGRAGMSEAGLIHHFPTKASLLRAVLERREEITAPFLPDVLTDPEAAVRGILELTRHNAELPGRVELFATISSEAVATGHPAHDYIVERYAAKRRLLVAAFGQLADAGLLQDGIDPESAARWSVALTDGLQLQWLLDRDSVDMVAEVRGFLRRITRLAL
jgi:AcrR family transcriptional regulator